MKRLNAFIAITVFATALGTTVLTKSALAAEIIAPRASTVKITAPKAAPIKIVASPAKHLILVDSRFEQQLKHRSIHPAPTVKANEPVTINDNVVNRTVVNRTIDPKIVENEIVEPGVVEPIDVHSWINPIDWATPVYVPEPVETNPVVQVNVQPSEPIVWENTHSINNSVGWTELMMPVHQTGRNLALNVQNGKSQLDSLEVHFGDGQVEQINLQDQTFGNGTYSLLNFGSQRYVNSVNLVARSQSPATNLTVRLQ